MLFLLLLCGFVSMLACALLVRFGRRSAARSSHEKPQRFHAGHIPRLGGIGMLLACIVGWCWMVVGQSHFGAVNGIRLSAHDAGIWILAATIATLGGAAEDIWHRMRARWRLAFTLASGICAVLLLDLSVQSLGLPQLDEAWRSAPWLGVLLAAVAIAGLPHAFNLIDGYNGLAGAVAVICCFAIAYVAFQVGDRQLAALVLALAAASGGFLLWNYPRGLLFAGDGGAYLWGTVIAMASILLVQRHPQVSPWFPMLLLSYPVVETVFSVYRKLARGQSPTVADALHFHQLIYRRIVRGVFDADDEAQRLLMRNNRTAPYLWGFALLTVLPAALFWQHTWLLMAVTAAFFALYVWCYLSIVRFRVPRWVKGTRRDHHR